MISTAGPAILDLYVPVLTICYSSFYCLTFLKNHPSILYYGTQ